MSDLTTTVLIEIRDELKDHGGILREHSAILHEHGEILRGHGVLLQEHSEILQEHSEILHGHGRRFDNHDSRLRALESTTAANGKILKQILGAVEYGNHQRDGRVDDLEDRVTRLEEQVGG